MRTARAALLIALLFFGIAIFAPSDMAIAQTAQQVEDGVKSIGGGDSPSLEGTIKLLLDAFFFIIGALAVIMIIYSGFRYITSAGDSSAVTSAKNTLLYSVVGLIIALSSYAIVNFVIDRFSGSPERPSTSNQGGAPDPWVSPENNPPSDCSNGGNC